MTFRPKAPDSQRSHAGRSIAVACAVALVALAGLGCGGGDDGEPAAAQRSEAKGDGAGREDGRPVRAENCEPIEVPTEVPGYLEIGGQGSRSSLSLEEINLAPGTAEVAVERLVTVPRVVSADDPPVEFAAAGTRFVAVIFEVENDGQEEVPALSLAGTFRLVTTDETAYAPVAVSEGCAGAAPSLAVSPSLPRSIRAKLVGPGFPIPAGETHQSLVVYAVPKGAKPSVWYSPRFESAVHVG